MQGRANLTLDALNERLQGFDHKIVLAIDYSKGADAIVGAYFKGLNFWETHPHEAYGILSKHFNDAPESLEKQFNGITMLDERDNRSAFTFAAGLQSLYGNLRMIGEFVSEQQKHKTSEFDTDKLIERRFIKNMEERVR